MLVAILLMSIGDLYMTLTHLTHAGMLEGNPVARVVMGYNSPGLLVAWKMATVMLALAILYAARHLRFGEIASVICLVLLVWLCTRWVTYSDQIASITPEMCEMYFGFEDRRWVAMP